jgi:hypothetical protein
MDAIYDRAETTGYSNADSTLCGGHFSQETHPAHPSKLHTRMSNNNLAITTTATAATTTAQPSMTYKSVLYSSSTYLPSLTLPLSPGTLPPINILKQRIPSSAIPHVQLKSSSIFSSVSPRSSSEPSISPATPPRSVGHYLSSHSGDNRPRNFPCTVPGCHVACLKKQDLEVTHIPKKKNIQTYHAKS